jgi:hypothetical protein
LLTSLQWQDFVFKLKTHLLPRLVRLLGLPPEAEKQCDWSKVILDKDQLYSHKTMRIRYTTYDVRRGEDVIHVDTPQCNVMLLDKRYDIRDKESAKFPYLYGKVLGILHATGWISVGFIGTTPWPSEKNSS